MEKFTGFCRIPPGGLPLRSFYPSILHRSGASYDRLVKVVTLLCWVGLISLDLWIIYVSYVESLPPRLSFFLVAITSVLVFGILIGTYVFSPRGYELTLSGVVVKRVLRSFEIPYGDIIDARRVGMPRGIRICASGGLHGFFGLFQLDGLGRVWMYVTNRGNLVLITTRRGVKYIISPDNPEDFLRKLSLMKRWYL